MYLGDITLGDTIDHKFSTVDASGAPTTLAGSPVISAYVGNGTTEITAGITLTVDFDGRTGLNNVRVVASGGNGFAASTNVSLVITTGTVDGNSVVGYVIGSFSIQARSAATPAQVNAEVLDVLNVDTFSEPGQGTLPAAPTIRQMAHYLFKVLRNRKRATGTVIEIYADNGTTVDHKIAHTETAGAYEKPEIASGP